MDGNQFPLHIRGVERVDVLPGKLRIVPDCEVKPRGFLLHRLQVRGYRAPENQCGNTGTRELS